MDSVDTIAAVCTGVGGAISIIRISGSGALEAGRRVWNGSGELGRKNSRKMLLGQTLSLSGSDGEPAIAVYMPGPNSYTGEDVVEIHCHGGALCAKKTLDAALAAGARAAEPGEFTYRAFVNGKMDLTQAEAVADLISAHSEMALHLAERQISGRLKDSVNEIRDKLVNILSECESRMDFPEEDLDWESPEIQANEIKELDALIEKLKASGREGALLRDGVRVVIAGRPNVGKSSLLNLLLGFDRAIVTQLPGTTRDTLEELANIRNIPVKLIDTAGIREADDLIEGMGIDRSKESIKQAQIVFWLLDASEENPVYEFEEMKKHVEGCPNVICVWNKIDACSHASLPSTSLPAVEISVAKNTGIDKLLDAFEKAAWGYPHTEEPEIAVSSRHAALLNEAASVLPEAAEKILSEDWELAATDMRSAIAALGAITGEDADPDVLDNIFSRFCIGK
jgi:tRNA modification GTPase